MQFRQLLHSFIERYEKSPETEPDLDRFHILDKNGNPTNAFDIAIVEEILEKVPFFVLRGIPYVYDHGVYREDPDGCRLKRVIQNHLYRKLKKIGANRNKDVTPETLIPIENIKAPVLMLSSKHDEVWPSYESAVYMEKKLIEIGFPYYHKHIAYEHMSHAVLTRLPWIYKMAFKSERRHPKECAKDRDALKEELLDWVNADW